MLAAPQVAKSRLSDSLDFPGGASRSIIGSPATLRISPANPMPR